MPNSISTVSDYPGVLALTQKYAVSPAYRRLKQLQLSDITNRLPRAKTAAQHSATAALSLGLGIGIGMLIANRDKVHDFNKKIGPALGHTFGSKAAIATYGNIVFFLALDTAFAKLNHLCKQYYDSQLGLQAKNAGIEELKMGIRERIPALNHNNWDSVIALIDKKINAKAQEEIRTDDEASHQFRSLQNYTCPFGLGQASPPETPAMHNALSEILNEISASESGGVISNLIDAVQRTPAVYNAMLVLVALSNTVKKLTSNIEENIKKQYFWAAIFTIATTSVGIFNGAIFGAKTKPGAAGMGTVGGVSGALLGIGAYALITKAYQKTQMSKLTEKVNHQKARAQALLSPPEAEEEV